MHNKVFSVNHSVALKEKQYQLKCLLSVFLFKVEELCGGPSLLMVLRRDNAASCFHSILKRYIVVGRHTECMLLGYHAGMQDLR